MGGGSGRVMRREAGPLPDPARRGIAWPRPEPDTRFWLERIQPWIPHSRDAMWETQVQTGCGAGFQKEAHCRHEGTGA